MHLVTNYSDAMAIARNNHAVSGPALAGRGHVSIHTDATDALAALQTPGHPHGLDLVLMPDGRIALYSVGSELGYPGRRVQVGYGPGDDGVVIAQRYAHESRIRYLRLDGQTQEALWHNGTYVTVRPGDAADASYQAQARGERINGRVVTYAGKPVTCVAAGRDAAGDLYNDWTDGTTTGRYHDVLKAIDNATR